MLCLKGRFCVYWNQFQRAKVHGGLRLWILNSHHNHLLPGYELHFPRQDHSLVIHIGRAEISLGPLKAHADPAVSASDVHNRTRSSRWSRITDLNLVITRRRHANVPSQLPPALPLEEISVLPGNVTFGAC